MSADGTFASTCWECSTLCGSLITMRDGKVAKIGPNPDHPGSKGAFCVKGIRALPEWTEHEPHRCRWDFDHLIDAGAGRSYRSASSRARASRSIPWDRRSRSMRATTSSTKRRSSAGESQPGMRTRMTPSTMRADTVFTRRSLRITSTG